MQRLMILFLIAGTLMTGHSLRAQIRNLPSQVTDSMKARYPAATKVSWKDKLSFWQAGFTIDSAKYEAKFNGKGEWISTEMGISPDKLPTAVKDGLAKSKYADWKIKAVSIVYLPAGLMQYYIPVVKSDFQKRNLLFSKEGQLLKDNITF